MTENRTQEGLSWTLCLLVLVPLTVALIVFYIWLAVKLLHFAAILVRLVF